MPFTQAFKILSSRLDLHSQDDLPSCLCLLLTIVWVSLKTLKRPSYYRIRQNQKCNYKRVSVRQTQCCHVATIGNKTYPRSGLPTIKDGFHFKIDITLFWLYLPQLDRIQLCRANFLHIKSVEYQTKNSRKHFWFWKYTTQNYLHFCFDNLLLRD